MYSSEGGFEVLKNLGATIRIHLCFCVFELLSLFLPFSAILSKVFYSLVHAMVSLHPQITFYILLVRCGKGATRWVVGKERMIFPWVCICRPVFKKFVVG